MLCLVLVMSTELLRGAAPAYHLSGGDYDGDKAFVTWDPRLTNHIKPLNTTPMPEPKQKDADDLDMRQGLSNILNVFYLVHGDE